MINIEPQFTPGVSFLPIFDAHYSPRLGKRRGGFRRIFELLERKRKRDYLIVETGCARWAGNWAGDGQSTLMWDHFVRTHSGAVYTVDLNPKHCLLCQSLVSAATRICCMDSVQFLWQFSAPQPIDLLYLDSFDLDVKDPHPSAMHHVKELCAVIGKLEKGTIIAVDDNFPQGPGKGMYLAQFLQNIGVQPVLNDYQMAWVL